MGKILNSKYMNKTKYFTTQHEQAAHQKIKDNRLRNSYHNSIFFNSIKRNPVRIKGNPVRIWIFCLLLLTITIITIHIPIPLSDDSISEKRFDNGFIDETASIDNESIPFEGIMCTQPVVHESIPFEGKISTQPVVRLFSDKQEDITNLTEIIRSCKGYEPINVNGSDIIIIGQTPQKIDNINTIRKRSGAPPYVNISTNPGLFCNVSEAITFDGSESSDPDGYITYYIWSINGFKIEGEELYTISYTFTEVGDYNVTLSITDNDNNIENATVWVTVLGEQEIHIYTEGSIDTWDTTTINEIKDLINNGIPHLFYDNIYNVTSILDLDYEDNGTATNVSLFGVYYETKYTEYNWSAWYNFYLTISNPYTIEEYNYTFNETGNITNSTLLNTIYFNETNPYYELYQSLNWSFSVSLECWEDIHHTKYYSNGTRGGYNPPTPLGWTIITTKSYNSCNWGVGSGKFKFTIYQCDDNYANSAWYMVAMHFRSQVFNYQYNSNYRGWYLRALHFNMECPSLGSNINRGELYGIEPQSFDYDNGNYKIGEVLLLPRVAPMGMGLTLKNHAWYDGGWVTKSQPWVKTLRGNDGTPYEINDVKLIDSTDRNNDFLKGKYMLKKFCHVGKTYFKTWHLSEWKQYKSGGPNGMLFEVDGNELYFMFQRKVKQTGFWGDYWTYQKSEVHMDEVMGHYDTTS